MFIMVKVCLSFRKKLFSKISAQQFAAVRRMRRSVKSKKTVTSLIPAADTNPFKVASGIKLSHLKTRRGEAATKSSC